MTKQKSLPEKPGRGKANLGLRSYELREKFMETLPNAAPRVLKELAKLLPIYRKAKMDWFTEGALIRSVHEPAADIRPELRVLRDALIDWQRNSGLLPIITPAETFCWFRATALATLSRWAGNQGELDEMMLSFPGLYVPGQYLSFLANYPHEWMPDALNWLQPPKGLPKWRYREESRDDYLDSIKNQAETALQDSSILRAARTDARKWFINSIVQIAENYCDRVNKEAAKRGVKPRSPSKYIARDLELTALVRCGGRELFSEQEKTAVRRMLDLLGLPREPTFKEIGRPRKNQQT